VRTLLRVLVVLAVVAGVGGVALWTSPALQDLVAARIARRRAAAVHPELAADGALRVVFCGTGSPIADPERGQACTAVFAGPRLFLVDAGAGAAERLAAWGVPLGGLEGVLLTHFHSDHIAGVGDVALMSWIGGRTRPMRLWGGPGVADVAHGFQTAYAADARYRVAHHSAEFLPPAGATIEPVTVEVPSEDEAVTVLDEGGLRIVAFRVRHPPVEPAYGYRFDLGGRSVLVSGDTAPTPVVVREGRDVDVMIHEALAPHMIEMGARAIEAAGDRRLAKLARDTPSYHTTPVDAARAANEANTRLLVLTHIVPPVSGALPLRIFLRGVSDVRPRGTIVAADGLVLELPANSSEIATRSLR
jgi:ribonuclease Z